MGAWSNPLAAQSSSALHCILFYFLGPVMQSSKRILCTICLPVYNEEDGIKLFLDSLYFHISQIIETLPVEFEVLAVDDGSTDSSLATLIEYSSHAPSLHIFSFQQNSGHQAAILCGLSHAKGDLIITMDSDGQDPPESILTLFQSYYNTGCEIVIAKRATRKDRFLKRLTAWFFYRILVLMGVPSQSRDAGDFRLISRGVRDLILSQPNSLQYIRGQLFTLKVPVSLVKINRKERIAGTTKYTLSKMLRLAVSSAFVVDPLRVSQLYISVAILSFIASLGLGLFFIVAKFASPTYYASGITTLALLIVSLFTVLVSMIAFQSLYVSLLFRSLRNEPAYIAKQIV